MVVYILRTMFKLEALRNICPLVGIISNIHAGCIKNKMELTLSIYCEIECLFIYTWNVIIKIKSFKFRASGSHTWPFYLVHTKRCIFLAS